MKKIETLAEYQQLAARTCVELVDLKQNLYHMNLGIITEVGEIFTVVKKKIAYGKDMDMVNIIEELGDLCWFIVNKDRILEQWPDRELKISATDNKQFEALCKEAGLFDNIDMNNVPVEEILMGGLGAILVQVTQELPGGFQTPGIGPLAVIKGTCEALQIDFWQMLTTNIKKLQIRYPDQFTEEAALNRNLEAERKVLED